MQSFINTFFSVKLVPFYILFSLIFSHRQPKRKLFWLRVLMIVFVVPMCYFLWEYVKTLHGESYFMLVNVFVQIVYFTVTVLFNWNCYECTFFEAVFYAIGGWTAESLSGAIAVVIGLKTGMEGVIYRDYSWQYFLTVLVVAIVCWGLIDFLFYKLCKDRTINLDRRALLVPVIIIFVVFVSLNQKTSALYMAKFEELIYAKYYTIACCILLLALILDLFFSGKYRLQIETLEQLDKKQKDQYEMSRDTVDVINAKCHDLKKMLSSSLANGKIMTQEEVERLQEKISIYDSFVQTGNNTLDLVLSEKNLYCEKNEIKLSVMASANRLEFMSKVDIYSVFANILDNAIEAVMKLEPFKRIVTLSVKEVGDILVIHEDNNFNGVLNTSDGKIQTSKADKTSHGYGIMSIRRVAEKYGGSMKTGVNDNVFHINVLIPIKK